VHSPQRKLWEEEEQCAMVSPEGAAERVEIMGHSYTRLLYHIIFSTKERRALLKGQLQAELDAYICGIARNLEMSVYRIGGIEDHRHILLSLPPTLCPAEASRLLKCNSTKWAHEKYPNLGHFRWQEGYAAFTVSESQVARVSRYIQNQQQHHHKRDFDEELNLLLRRHGIEILSR
jgi:REP element-mobilizing transposase RayT